jgi:signal transduction histidine kinase/ligand-binding sensor domain-containing protein/DNA-binding NarL/FixJ family response regulator
VLLLNVAHAQNADPIRYIGIEHGLSNNSVICIYQDHNGFMWFGTYDGLNRYDGYQFKVYRNRVGDSTSLLDNTVYSIQGDKNHVLWIAGRKGLSLFNPITNSFSTVTYADLKNHSQKIDGTVHAVKIDENNNVLVGTESNGLVLFPNETNKGRQIPLVRSSGFITEHYEVSSIELNQDKQYAWIFIENEGLALYDRKKNAVTLVNTYFKKINCLKSDNKGHLWVGTDNGCHRYDVATNSFSGNYLTAQSRIVNITIDKLGTLWLSSDGGDGLFILSPGEYKVRPFKVDGQNVLSSNAVFSVYEDTDGRKWIGTLRGGIDVIESYQNPFKKIFDNSDKPVIPAKNFINCFCETPEKKIWIGTSQGGLKYWDRYSNTYINYLHDPQSPNSISSNAITYIVNASNQTWIATWNGGINRFDHDKKSFEHYSCFNPYTSAIENNVWLLYEDSKKTLWASTTNNGTLYTYNRERNKFEIFDPKLVNIQCLTEDGKNNLWAGNYSSLIKIDRVNKKHTSYEIGYAVRSIHEDGMGNLWVGTDGGGLLKFNKQNENFVRFTMDNGLTNNSVLRILEDKKGNLWLSTFNGLSQFDTKKNQFRNFSQSDGLQSNQFNFNAAASLSTGEFVFGGIKGFNVFHPDSIYERKETPQLFLTAIRVNNKGIEENDSYVKERELETIKKITVPFDQAILSIEFVALDYNSTDKIKYAYQLQGWDKNWNYVNNIRTANYSRLQEGTYTFKIRVTNSDGIWSEGTNLLKITILPPWYRTWWAYTIYVLILFGAIYLYVVYSKRQERLKYEVKLAHLENEKEKELTEKKISFFTHISHEFRTPLTLIINPLKDLVSSKNNENERKNVFMIYRNARRLLSLVDQLLLFRKVESVDQHLRIERFDIAEACHDVFLSFNHHAISKNIDFSFEKTGSEIFVYGDKEKIEIILFNLVSNAFKYTNPGGKITLMVRDNLHQVEISVKDTGSGIPLEVGNKLFESFYQANNTDKSSQMGFGIGLYVSNKLVAAHHGQLTYSSDEGKGTEFILSLLKGKEHFPSLFINEDLRTENNSTILQELVEDTETHSLSNKSPVRENKSKVIDQLTSDLPSMLIVDDNAEIRSYIKQIFTGTFNIYEAEDGIDGYEQVLKESPDVVISDIKMKKMDGIELCQKIKNNPSFAHIPVILLTASSSDEIKLKGIEGGAEDYITKPFDKEIIVARVQNILKGRDRLQQYFFNAVTLKPVTSIAGEHKQFIERCIAVVEDHLDNPDFTIQTFCKAVGMSHPSLYKKVKAVSGLTINVFIRYIRLRKAADLLITTDKTITEIAYITGFNDIRYFREQFLELFKMRPSDYVKNYRKVLRGKTVES